MTPTELIEGLEHDGILRTVETYFQTDEAVVCVAGNVGRVVELLGLTRHLSAAAWAVLDTLYQLQDRAWDAGDYDTADAIAEVRFPLGVKWHSGLIAKRAMEAYHDSRRVGR